MYGVPADLDLTGFHGTTLILIGVAEQTLHFTFQPETPSPLYEVVVEGGWDLRDAAGDIIDRKQDHATRDVYRVHRVLGRTVVSSAVDGPKSFTLQFDSGHKLTVYDDSDRYESFSIQPGDVYV